MERWSEVETDILLNLYPKYGADFCSKLLPNRTKRSIILKASKLKVKLSQRNQDRKKSPEEYQEEMKHSDYEVLEPYISSSKKILHRHKRCGYEWKVSPNNLRKLAGCPRCSDTGKNYLYLLKIEELDLYKIGISSNIKRRMHDLSNKYNIVCICYWYFEDFEETYMVEQALLKKLSLYNTYKLNSGNTETFKWCSSQGTLLNWLETELSLLTKRNLPAKFVELQKN